MRWILFIPYDYVYLACDRTHPIAQTTWHSLVSSHSIDRSQCQLGTVLGLGTDCSRIIFVVRTQRTLCLSVTLLQFDIEVREGKWPGPPPSRKSGYEWLTKRFAIVFLISKLINSRLLLAVRYGNVNIVGLTTRQQGRVQLQTKPTTSVATSYVFSRLLTITCADTASHSGENQLGRERVMMYDNSIQNDVQLT